MKRAPSIDSPADFQWSNNKFPSKKNKIVRSRRSYIGSRSNVMMRKKKYTLQGSWKLHIKNVKKLEYQIRYFEMQANKCMLHLNA